MCINENQLYKYIKLKDLFQKSNLLYVNTYVHTFKNENSYILYNIILLFCACVCICDNVFRIQY